jgi:hypothetical protein
MYVVVVHTIHDAETFWGTVQRLIDIDGIPGTVKVHACYPDPSGTKAVCLQEAPSIDPVRDSIEESFGVASDNEYFAVAASSSFASGLPCLASP